MGYLKIKSSESYYEIALNVIKALLDNETKKQKVLKVSIGQSVVI